MTLFFSVIVFLFGLAVGSFLNCLIHRLAIGEKFLVSRSYCPHCQQKLNWQDLIPVLSFLFLRGKCRSCHKSISWQYPLVEIATGALFVLCFLFELPYYIFVIVPFLVVIFVYDLKHYLIPDRVIYPAIAIALIFHIYQLSIDHFLSALIAAAFFLTIVLISQGKWMGVGDIKLGFLMGLILGWPDILVGLFLAFMMGAIIGIGLIVFNKKTLKSAVPFGPFLVTGTLAALFWGQKIITWYLNLFNP